MRLRQAVCGNGGLNLIRRCASKSCLNSQLLIHFCNIIIFRSLEVPYSIKREAIPWFAT
jgi:hypothetical protein